MQGWDLVFKYIPKLMEGLGYTVISSVCAIIIGLLVGLTLAVIRLGKNRIINSVISVYISFVRGTPVIVQIFIIFYVLSDFVDLPPLTAGIIALSLNSGGFIAEIIRGGFTAIPKGQYEVCEAMGFSYLQTLRRVILPQVFKITLPQFLNEFIAIIKVSPLLSMIGVEELTRVAQMRINNLHEIVPLPFYITLFAIYFLFNSLLEFAAGKIEKKALLRKGGN